MQPLILPSSQFPDAGPALYANVPMAQYLALNAASQSTLKLMDDKTPEAVKERRDTPVKTGTKATELGTAAHSYLMEPMEFMKEYAVSGPCSAKTAAGDPCKSNGKNRVKKKWYCGTHTKADMLPDTVKTVVQPDYTRLLKWSKRISASRRIQDHLALPGGFELTLLWIDPQTGVLCKARADFLGWAPTSGDFFIARFLEMKTAADASHEGFSKSAANFGYHRKAAWYEFGAAELGFVGRSQFQFVILGKDASASVALRHLGPLEMQLGRDLNRSALNRYAECVRLDNWPGYDLEQSEEINFPEWAFK